MNFSISFPSRIFLAGLCCLLVSNTGCKPAGNDAVNAQQNEAEDLASIQAQALKFSAAYVKGEVDELVSIYTADGMAAPGGRDFIVGRTDLRPFWETPAGNKILRHKTTSSSLVIDGDHAYDWGYYEGQSEREGEVLPPFKGKYVIVWERGDDGIWRMAADMWNSLPPSSGE